ncbi:Zn-ribbon domain-containing OB-fold protein [Streptomyces sp. NPDC096311]|uniref:Zn-ribbon domain-containing OB-fold protein n=1 Tax=Streptomyces sp. NPDC096311 TaxID=3366083 RepID=UPI0037F1226A
MRKLKMQPYVKMWYEFFAEGKIMGLACNRCGAYEFPPVPVCNACSGTGLDWVEMSGEGELTSFKVALHPDQRFVSAWPYVSGNVILKEGPVYGGMVLGVGPEDVEDLYERLPLPVQGEVQDRGDHKFLVFRLKH